MNRQEKTAVVLGATGLTGNLLLKELLNDAHFTRVTLFSRKPIGFTHPKLKEHVIDVLHLKKSGHLFKGDIVFCCIGTTRSKTPNRELYRAIDYGIPVNAAELCVLNGINTFIVVSALGADAKSAIFYNKTKGEMEERVLALNIKKTHILQPALIGGNRKEKRIVEWSFKWFMKLIDPFLVGSLRKYRSISPHVIARCMLWLSKNPYEGRQIVSDEIQNIIKNNPVN